MKREKYGAFTLVEMLIVMGILSVLMAIGVSVARFAIQRANNIQHQNAVDQMFQAMQSFYTDNRRYPTDGVTNPEFESFSDALDAGGVLDLYVDANFDGGSPARFYYFTDGGAHPQEFLVCVSYAEDSAIPQYGGYCNGNGFGVVNPGNGEITEKVLDDSTNDYEQFRDLVHVNAGNDSEVWNGTDWE